MLDRYPGDPKSGRYAALFGPNLGFEVNLEQRFARVVIFTTLGEKMGDEEDLVPMQKYSIEQKCVPLSNEMRGEEHMVVSAQVNTWLIHLKPLRSKS